MSAGLRSPQGFLQAVDTLRGAPEGAGGAARQLVIQNRRPGVSEPLIGSAELIEQIAEVHIAGGGQVDARPEGRDGLLQMVQIAVATSQQQRRCRAVGGISARLLEQRNRLLVLAEAAQ